MRVVSGIDEPLRDEHVLETDPPFRPRVSGTWRRRLNAFPGRALSAEALTAEQDRQAGAQRLRGRAVTAGVIEGLGLAPDADALGSTPEAAFVTVEVGMGIARSGEDLHVPTPRRFALGNLRTHARVDVLDAVADGAPAPPTPAPGDADPAFPGLRPPLPRRTGPRFADVIGAAAADALPRVAVLTLEPVSVAILADARDDCPPDPRNDPYEDLQLIDGVRPLLVFWPSEMVAGDGGPDYALPVAGPTFRNALAHRVFAMERRLGAEGAHPWEEIGLPLAILGFEPDWTLAFVDRAAVSRVGGAPKVRSAVVAGAGTPALWQAQAAQFAEQVLSLRELTPERFAATFRTLPPVGVLPRAAADPIGRRRSVFPVSANVYLRPVPEDQIDLAVAESASLAPLRLDRPETVELLGPVPADVYEPRLFEIEAVDPAFAAALRRIGRDRSRWLARREHVRRRLDLLSEAVFGQRRAWPVVDSPPAEISPEPDQPPLSAARFRRVGPGANPSFHGVANASRPLRVERGGRMFVWVRLVDTPAAAGIALFGDDPRAGGAVPEGTFWGSVADLPGFPDGAARRAGDLPAIGAWTRLEVASDAWRRPDAEPDASREVRTLTFGQSGGTTVEWGPAGHVDGVGNQTIWIADAAPHGADYLAPEGAANQGGWSWQDQPAAVTAAALEIDFGVVAEDSDRLAIAAVSALEGRWTQPFLSDEFEALDSGGLDGFVETLEQRIARTNDRIDLGFVRARTDIYRLRRFVLGGDAAARLVTSPALAEIAVREDSARATAEELTGFFRTAYTSSADRDPDDPLSRLPRTEDEDGDDDPTRVDAGGGAAADRGAGGGGRVSPFLAQPASATGLFGPVTARLGPTFGPTLAFDAITLQPERRAGTALAGDAGAVSLAALQAGLTTRPVVVDDLLDQRPLIGAVERTASVGERLTQPPAVEVHEYAIAGKREALAAAGALGTGGAARDGVALDDLVAPGWGVRGDDGEVIIGRTATIEEVTADPEAFVDVDAVSVGTNRHEAEYFGAATASIDNSIALLRLIEGRVAIYRGLLADARKVRDEVRGVIAAADTRLRAIDTEVAEARHDAGVAAALLAEDEARVDAINDRRRAVIERHVDRYLFRRPRRTPLVPETPVAAVAATLPADVSLICPPDDGAAPEELREYVELLRETPAAWWKAAQSGLTLIDRLPAARAALVAVRRRAAAPPAAAIVSAASSPAARMVAGVISAGRATAESRRVSALSLDLAAVDRLDLSTARQGLLAHAALADLMAGAHRRQALARRIGEEVERIGDAASCLHARFSEVAPIIRLGWAEALSAFDRPVPLSDLSTLEDWGAVPLELRRELQRLVDWLFDRIERRVDAAERAINELVRIALLTAAEAPVDRLVPARLVAPAPVRVGSVLTLSTNVLQARVGMIARLAVVDGGGAVEATVEDIGDGAVRARIVQVAAGTQATIGGGARFELFHARLT